MKSAKNIEDLIRTFEVEANEQKDQKVLSGLLKAHAESKNLRPSSAWPNIWRTTMRKPFAKLTTLAVVIVIAVLGITFLDKAATPSWAIEETIDLLKNFNAIQCSGTMLDEQGKHVSFEAWFRANKEQTGADSLRLETQSGEIDVVWEHRRYVYDPATQTVKITEGYGDVTSIWFGASLFESLKEMVLDWKESYAKDPATGRDRVFVTCSHPTMPSPRSFWFEFDVESKLLISFKQWENMTRQGTPEFYVKSITYLDDLPDELFQLETDRDKNVD